MVKRVGLCLALGSLAACDLSLTGAQISCSTQSDCPSGWTCNGSACVQAGASSSGATGGSSGVSTSRGSSGGVGSNGGSSGSSSTSGGSTGSASSTGGSSGTTGALPSFSSLSVFVGAPGSFGNADGQGDQARFNVPRGIASDAQGNLYVADLGNSTVRMITPSGQVTTLAGQADAGGANIDGAGAAARFDNPTGIVADDQGNLYVADGNQCTIRKIVIDGGLVTTIAGDAGVCVDQDSPSPVELHAPIGLTYDGFNLYIAENGGVGAAGNRIRRLTLATGLVSTVSGSGAAGLVNDAGLAAEYHFPLWIAFDAGTNSLYVADENNDVLRQVEFPAAEASTFAGTGTEACVDGPLLAAEFDQPHGLAFGGLGNLYVADWSPAIREISGGVVTTIAGSPGDAGGANGSGAEALFNEPVGLSVIGNHLYVAEQGNNDVREVTTNVSPATVATLAGAASGAGTTDGDAGTGRFRGPRGVVFDGKRTIYVADSTSNTIRAVGLNHGFVATVAGVAEPALLVDAGSVDGPVLGVGAATFDTPWDLAYDPTDAGYLYVSDNGSNSIRRIDLGAGLVSTLRWSDAGPQLVGPKGVALDGNGNLYVGTFGNNEIVAIDLATSAATVFAGSPTGVAGFADQPGTAALFSGPAGVICDGQGNLYVSDTFNRVVRKVTLDGGVVSTVAGTPDMAGQVPLLNSPDDLAYDPRGYLYLSNNETIRLVNLNIPPPNVTLLFGVPWQRGLQTPLPGVLNDAHGLAWVPSQGGLFIADFDENVILLATPAP